MSTRIPFRLALTLLLAALAGCATGPRIYTHVMPEADFDGYRTFGWPEEVGTDRGGYETHITQYFKAAARREMEALGYRYTDEDPDLLVNFFTHVETREHTYTRTSVSPWMSAGYYSYRYHLYTAWPVYYTEVDTLHYQVGTANIDLIDARTHRMIWEGRAEGELTERALEDPETAIRNVVAKIFERFPTREPRR